MQSPGIPPPALPTSGLSVIPVLRVALGPSGTSVARSVGPISILGGSASASPPAVPQTSQQVVPPGSPAPAWTPGLAMPPRSIPNASMRRQPPLPTRWAAQFATHATTAAVSSTIAALSALSGLASERTVLAGRSSGVAHDPAPVPATAPFGAGAEGAAGGASGFFFFGVAALAALAALSVPRVIRMLREFGASRAAQPFVLLLERPG
jgi:hypothetical protein